MTRFQELDGYQKLLIFALLAMFLLFTVLCAVTTSRVGYEYMGAILAHSNDNGTAVYSGEIKGKQACFTVTSDRVITFTYGDKTYGPYTVKEDPTAIPKDTLCTEGIEIREGEEIFFRGSYYFLGGFRFFENEDGTTISPITVTSDNGITMDENGNIIDTMEPSLHTILAMHEGPKLTNKGSWGMWFFSTLLMGFTIVSILFADALFRMGLSFRVKNPDMAEPTDWEVATRYIGWTLGAIVVLVIYIKALQ